jgi:hypothetical protein
MATLTGRIEAIGMLELLRVPVTNESTGKLVIFDERLDAELFYREGRLLHATSGGRSGSAALCRVLSWSAGEFEFIAGAEARGADGLQLESYGLHEELLACIKQWYAMRTSKRTASGSVAAPELEVARTVPRLVTAAAPRQLGARSAPLGTAIPRAAASRARHETESGPELLAEGSADSGTRRLKTAPPPLPKSRRPESTEAGPPLGVRAVIDPAGHVLSESPDFGVEDAEIAALIHNLAQTMGQRLSAGALEGAEVRGSNGKWLFLEERGATVVAAVVPAETEFRDVFGGEES